MVIYIKGGGINMNLTTLYMPRIYGRLLFRYVEEENLHKKIKDFNIPITQIRKIFITEYNATSVDVQGYSNNEKMIYIRAYGKIYSYMISIQTHCVIEYRGVRNCAVAKA
jgi:hypothetical protein